MWRLFLHFVGEKYQNLLAAMQTELIAIERRNVKSIKKEIPQLDS